MGETNRDRRLWYAIYTHSKHEERVEKNLEAWGVTTFYPRIRTKRYQSFSRTPIYICLPFFSRYLFARFDAETLLAKIRYTRGVHSVVSFNGVPAPVPESIIEFISSRVGPEGFVEFRDELEIGTEVEVIGGPLKGFVGILNREIGASGRVSILLHAIQYQGHIQVERELIKKAATA